VSRPDTTYDLSVVIPAFNEASRIVEPLRRIDGYLRTAALTSEIIVVDDGSSDGTAARVRGVGAGLSVPVTVIPTSPNRGKGHAVKVGMLEARGKAVLMADADLATPIEELGKLLPHLSNGVQVAIGSRKMPGARIEVHQPVLREAMGRVFTLLVNVLVVRASDVTCGFKLFTREAANAIFSRLTIDDWSFDAEVLYIARRLGYRTREVPVMWRDVAGTKVHRGLDALRSLRGIGRILWNGVRGRYDRPAPKASGTP
jgi:dolichyl-phosphate beta-glucosyltransferase